MHFLTKNKVVLMVLLLGNVKAVSLSVHKTEQKGKRNQSTERLDFQIWAHSMILSLLSLSLLDEVLEET